MLLRIGAFFLIVVAGMGQNRVSPENFGERVFAVVPMIGRGTLDDPRRPMFTVGGRGQRGPRVNFEAQVSDDGNYALVEFSALKREDLREILESRDVRVKIFRKGRHSREEILTEFRKHKKDIAVGHLREKAGEAK